MELHYYRDRDSLQVERAPAPSADLKEVADGLVLDFDELARSVGIKIQLIEA